jgi:hypothetical protein
MEGPTTIAAIGSHHSLSPKISPILSESHHGDMRSRAAGTDLFRVERLDQGNIFLEGCHPSLIRCEEVGFSWVHTHGIPKNGQ